VAKKFGVGFVAGKGNRKTKTGKGGVGFVAGRGKRNKRKLKPKPKQQF